MSDGDDERFEAFNDYQAEAVRTSGGWVDMMDRLKMGAIGLGGESGEVQELIKKAAYHDKPLEPAALEKELGDVIWYVADICEAAGLNFAEVASRNVSKLRARYPDGYVSGGGKR